jgi:branched-chain amino acid transport system ATP-binding protein
MAKCAPSTLELRWMAESLSLKSVTAGYGGTHVLEGIELALARGESLAIIGRNGVGKSTLLETVMGHTSLHDGRISLGGRDITALPPHARALAGVGYVPQEREIFPSLTTEENLAVSALPGGWSMGAVLDLFPALKERLRTTGNRLSGGEQQMLAIGRALVGGPKVLLLDEPLEGLAPVVVEALFEALPKIRDAGASIVLVEQNAELALAFAQHAAVLDRGKVVHFSTSAALGADEATQARLLGVAR